MLSLRANRLQQRRWSGRVLRRRRHLGPAGRRVLMDDILWLVRLVRQVEALLLPLLPRGWRAPPPSYRLIVPLLGWLGRHRQYPWVEALLFTLQTQVYPPYHEWG